MSPPVLSKLDRAFLNGESLVDTRRLPPGRKEELREILFYYDEWEIRDTLTVHVVKTGDGKLWGYCEGIYPGEETWYDEAPLFPVEEHEVRTTTYRQPGGETIPDSVLQADR